MAAKTYKFEKFTPQNEDVYMAKASELRFLPAQALRIEGFRGKPGFTDFVIADDTKEGWVFVPRRPKDIGHHTLCILNI